MTNLGFGKRVKAIREKLHKNQTAFGKMFTPNASKSVVSRWEHGGTPTSDRLEMIAKIGGVSTDYLLNGSIDESTETIADNIQKIYKKYYDSFNKRKPKSNDDKPIGNYDEMAFTVISFITHDFYTALPKAWSKKATDFTEEDFSEIKQFYQKNLLAGLEYCRNEVNKLARPLKITPDQTFLLLKLFQEVAASHYNSETRDNQGVANIVSKRLTDMEEDIHDLTHKRDSYGDTVLIPTSIDEDFLAEINNLIKNYRSELSKLKNRFNVI